MQTEGSLEDAACRAEVLQEARRFNLNPPAARQRSLVEMLGGPMAAERDRREQGDDARVARVVDTQETRRGGRDPAEREGGRRERERESEGDLTVSGIFLSRLHLVDVHIVSLTAPSRAEDWLKRKPDKNPLKQQLAQAIANKRSKYKALAMARNPGIAVDPKEPLSHLGITLIPAVATPTGTITEELLSFLKTLANHRIEYEKTILKITSGHLRRYSEYVGLYKRVVACALARSSVKTLTSDPRRLDSRRRNGPNLTYRAGDL